MSQTIETEESQPSQPTYFGEVIPKAHAQDIETAMDLDGEPDSQERQFKLACLLNDLRHYADYHSLDFDDALRESEQHYWMDCEAMHRSAL